MRRVIGLTGGIASGKSTVARLLEKMGAMVIDADRVGHACLEPGSAVYQWVRERYGVFQPDGRVDRRALGEILFADARALAAYNAVIHPEILRRVQAEAAHAKGEGAVVIDAPLLFETGMDALCTETWLVTADRETRIARIARRDGLSRAQAEARMHSQMPEEEKARRATHVIDNHAGLAELEREAGRLFLIERKR